MLQNQVALLDQTRPMELTTAAPAPALVVMGDCSRTWLDVVSAFVITLVALTFSLSGSPKHLAASRRAMLFVPLLDIFQPLRDLAVVIRYSCGFVAMVRICHKLEDESMRCISFKWLQNFCSLFYPWSKSPARILSGCDIVVYVLQDSDQEGPTKNSELLQNEWLWDDGRLGVDETEALVIGEDGARETSIMQYKKKELSLDGKVALVWGEYFSKHDEYKFLPSYHELKFLRGNSSFAVIAIAIQAFEYAYAVLYRSVKDLRVAPIEVIALVLNIIMLMKASLYSISNPCSRSLVIYMNEEHEKNLMNVLKLKDIRSGIDIEEEDIAKFAFGIFTIVSLCLYIPIIYYTLNTMKDTNIILLMPLFIFSLGIFVKILMNLIMAYDHIFWSTIIINAIAYIWAIAVTLIYWKSHYYHIRVS